MENFLVFIMVGLAAVYIGRLFLRSIRPGAGCGCGCGGCERAAGCGAAGAEGKPLD